MEELTSLPGVGRKTANVVLGNAFDQNVGIVVDTHVTRLSNRLGLTSHKSDAVKIEKDLMQIVPQNEWTMFSHLLIHHGRQICQAQIRNARVCPLLPILSCRTEVHENEVKGQRHVSATARVQKMRSIEIILLLFAVVAALAFIANRMRVPYPLLLVVGGLLLGFVPHLPRIGIEPDYVFLLFLPPLLYYAALNTSWRDFAANARPISFLAVGLTLITTATVAAIAHFMLPGFSWPVAFVLGAIISPPDAIAATAIAERLRVPKRIVTILEGESLVNDAIALVAYKFAVGAVVTGYFSLPQATVQFVVVSVGGVAVGYVVGLIVAWIRPRLNDAAVEGAISLLTPYIAYIPAERLHVSGVLATVTCGLYMTRRLPHIVAPVVRMRTYAVWDTIVFLLNGLVFILIGLELPEILADLRGVLWHGLVRNALLISLAAIVVRIVWVFPATYIPRWLWKSVRERDPTSEIRRRGGCRVDRHARNRLAGGGTGAASGDQPRQSVSASRADPVHHIWRDPCDFARAGPDAAGHHSLLPRQR